VVHDAVRPLRAQDGAVVTLFEAEAPVPRPPGWNLIANLGGVHGWHVVDRTIPDGGVVTVCGVTGRVITSNARAIVPCPNCSTD
jgi:hypothetical protein